MHLIKNILPEEYSDRLFIITLSAVLTFYIFTTSLFILNRRVVDPFAPSAKLPKRITQLIINLPKPVQPKALIKPKPRKSPLKERLKEKLAENKPVKKVAKKPKAIKKKPQKKARQKMFPKKIAVAAKPEIPKKVKDSTPKIDLETLGMLSLVSVIDETEPVTGSPNYNAAPLKTVQIIDFKEGDVFEVQDQPDITIDELTTVDEKAREITEQIDEELDYTNGFEAMFSENDMLEIEKPGSAEDYVNDATRNSEIIQQIVSEYTNGMKFCYNNSLRKAETLKGTVVVKFTILGSGMTDKVSIISNEIRDQRLEHCIIGIIFRWEFPPSKIDNLVVTYPISFVKTS